MLKTHLPEVMPIWIFGNRTAHCEERSEPTALTPASTVGMDLSINDFMEVTRTGGFNRQLSDLLLWNDSVPSGDGNEPWTSTVTDCNIRNTQRFILIYIKCTLKNLCFWKIWILLSCMGKTGWKGDSSKYVTLLSLTFKKILYYIFLLILGQQITNYGLNISHAMYTQVKKQIYSIKLRFSNKDRFSIVTVTKKHRMTLQQTRHQTLICWQHMTWTEPSHGRLQRLRFTDPVGLTFSNMLPLQIQPCNYMNDKHTNICKMHNLSNAMNQRHWQLLLLLLLLLLLKDLYSALGRIKHESER